MILHLPESVIYLFGRILLFNQTNCKMRFLLQISYVIFIKMKTNYNEKVDNNINVPRAHVAYSGVCEPSSHQGIDNSVHDINMRWNVRDCNMNCSSNGVLCRNK